MEPKSKRLLKKVRAIFSQQLTRLGANVVVENVNGFACWVFSQGIEFEGLIC